MVNYQNYNESNYFATNNSTSTIQRYLDQLPNYPQHNHPILFNQISYALQTFHNLSLGSSQYITDTGTQYTLLKLSGTVGISYKNNKYNIPIGLWIPEHFPTNAPIVYVEPTRTMHVSKNHEYVAQDGKVHLPYLNTWTTQSSLKELIEICVAVFSASPPVRANRNQQTQQQQQGYGYVQQQPPAYSNYYQQSYTQPPPGYYQNTIPQAIPSQSPFGVKENFVKKVRVEVEKRVNQIQKEVNLELENQKKIDDNEIKLNQSIQKVLEKSLSFQNKISEQEKQIRVLKSQVGSEEEQTKPVKKVTEEDIRKAVVSGDSYTQQLIPLVSKINAVDDTFYALEKALGDEVISLDSFLRSVRKLAREQFKHKALANKIYNLQTKS
eukprot:snap_masked-scaffold_18-processed-gene-6.50-mRNA-1 protein AED:1.00 eAED:1.00 QI:0/-1/0/0/-1/1/1/0/380